MTYRLHEKANRYRTNCSAEMPFYEVNILMDCTKLKGQICYIFFNQRFHNNVSTEAENNFSAFFIFCHSTHKGRNELCLISFVSYIFLKWKSVSKKCLSAACYRNTQSICFSKSITKTSSRYIIGLLIFMKCSIKVSNT